ncbi:MAG: hypothetical protein VXY16_11725, partial [Pseudomonadota bacterium]|nr:hypothetical protein [Pseudomonadota bacterium]
MILGLVNRYLNKFKPKAETRKRSGFSNESGNVFFTLFGAVALVGVVGVATSTLMRGPVGTVVQLNQRAKADAQMQIAQKLAMLEAAQQAQSGDCDADGFVEPIGAKTVCTGPTPSGGGCIPDAIGASKTDPWGTNYGYCSWDHGGVIGSGCATNSTGILDGTNDDAEIVIAIISAGPDRTFNSTCANHNTYVTKTPGSDDIVLDITYSGAVEASGGMWYLQSGDPDTAGIDKNIYVSGSGDFEGGGRFGAGIQMDSGAFDMQLGSYLLLPTQATSGACDSSTNKGALRRFVQGDDTEILEICDSANLGWTNVANAGAGSGAQGPAGALQLSDGATPTGFMYTSALSYTGGVLSTDGFNATGNAAINGTLSVDGNIDDPTGDVIIDDALNVTGNTDVDGTFNVDGTTTLAGTTVTSLNATGAVDFDNTLNVDGASTLAGTTVTTLGVSGASNFQGPASFGAAIFNSAGNLDLNDDVDITGNTTISGNAEISGDVFGAAFRNMYDGQDEGLFFDSANGLFLGVNGSPALSVDASGDVGINISGSPTAQLDIEGELRLRSSASYAAGAGCSAPGMIAYNGADELLICSSITGLWETVGTSGGGGGSAGGVWDDEGDYIKYENGTYITNAGTSLTFSSALEGPGTRMLWYTSQGAFRVGSVTGSQWNETNIGQNSVAFGIDTISDGTASFVAGDSSQATSSSAIALGSEVEARAPSSIALGNEAIVSAGATNSMAIGLGLPSTSTNPQVLSPNSLGIFMGDQQGVSLNTTNTMLLAGGRLVIDPDTTSATNIAPSNLLTVDVEGQVGATQYCDEDGLYCFLAADVAGGATPAPGADTEVLFNSGGILGADPSFVFYRSTGNLGLGVTDPEAQIHLSEQLLLGNINDCTAATQGALRLSVSGDVIEMCDFAGAGGYVAIGGASVAAPGSDRELIFNSGGLLAADANLSFTSSGVLQVVRNATTQAIDITGGIRITSDISNLADFQMNSNGLLAAESNMYFNIDSDNDVTTNAFIFGHNANTSAATELMRLQENGRLGLGVTTPQTRMDVDGTLKIAFGNEACDAAREGALHFNSSDNNFYVCQTNGNGWQRIITAGGGGGGLPAAGADRQIQFNSGNELAADANFVFTSAGNMGIGTANPTSKLYIFENYTADGYKTAMSVEMDTSGSASAYRGVVGLQTTAINDATGAGFKEAYGLYTVGRAGNDASAQTAIGVASRVDVHAGDTGMIYSATDDGSSTGGSQYAMYINLDDADVNSYGIYQQSNNPNALFGTLGIGTQTPSSQLHLYRSGGNASALIEGDENNSSDVTLLTSGDGASTVGDATATGWSLSARGNAFATATVQNDLMYYYWNGAAYQQRFLLENDTGNLVLSDTDVVGDTKLDVDGTLKIAYGNEACDAAREGAIHFDSSDNNFYVCPASGSWQRVITAGGGGTPAGGNDREIQFNSGSSLAGATNFVYTPEGDFIVGAYQIDDTGTGSEDSRMYFDVSNSAFRAGRAQSGQWNFASAGQYSAAFGNNTAATAMSSFATGFNTVAGGSHSVAMGSSSNASGIASVAMGQGSVASGNYSIALGNSANATQTGSISLGNTDSVGVNSFAAGDLVQASGNYSTAIGKSAIAAGSNSMALGLSTGTVANRPSVSGANSLGIFIGSQNNINFSSSDTMGIFGGAVVIDPQQPATNLSADTALEIEGTLKIAYGNEACDASRIGAIHFDSSAERFFVCQNAGEGWVNIATNNATAADPQRGIQFKSGDNLAASNNFVYTPEGDFIVGSSQIDDTGTGSEDSRMYFDVSNSAFRAGS